MQKKNCEATIDEKIYHLPRALSFQIKRTYFCSKTRKHFKIHSPIHFEYSIEINKKNFVIDYQRCRSYKLKAVIHHEGDDFDTGHYFTHVYCEDTCAWVQYDDEERSVLTRKEMLSMIRQRSVIMLLYSIPVKFLRFLRRT